MLIYTIELEEKEITVLPVGVIESEGSIAEDPVGFIGSTSSTDMPDTGISWSDDILTSDVASSVEEHVAESESTSTSDDATRFVDKFLCSTSVY